MSGMLQFRCALCRVLLRLRNQRLVTAVLVPGLLVMSHPCRVAAIIGCMEFAQLFFGFLQPVALGSLAVFLLLGMVSFRSHRRTPVLITRRPNR